MGESFGAAQGCTITDTILAQLRGSSDLRLGKSVKIAEEIVTRFDLLNGVPPGFAEAGNLRACGLEFFPRGACKQVEPVVPLCHVFSFSGPTIFKLTP